VIEMKKFVLISSLLILIFLFGCAEQVSVEEVTTEPSEGSAIDWKETALKDVITGNTFKISDFKGKSILVESFAVWCPTCKKQQDKVKELHEEVGDTVISISLDTDPNEEEAQVIAHANENGFDWLFAVSPKELTQSLIDEFGVNVVNAPQAPVILICEDQSARLLERGVKSADKLKSEIEKGC
jgi:thiol-disulfide isomerase/thioredoxin